MRTQLKVLFVGSKMPTQAELDGAKTTRPSLTVVAPANIVLLLPMTEGRGSQLKVSVVGSKMPTQLALYGAKTTRPLPAVVAPTNFLL